MLSRRAHSVGRSAIRLLLVLGPALVSCRDTERQQSPERVGSWAPLFPWPIVAVHANVLPDGRVLAWGLAGHPVVWDPGSGTFTTVPSPSPVFCSGHAFMADGRLFVAGGETTTFLGRNETVIFDPVTTRWTSAEPMRYARYYPTVTTLGDGSMASVAGQDERGKEVTIPELWSGGGWRELTGRN